MTYISNTRRAVGLKFCIRNAFMFVMTHAKFDFNRLILTLIFGIWASEPLPSQRTEMAGPDRAHPISSKGPFSPLSMTNFNSYRTSAGIKLIFCAFSKNLIEYLLIKTFRQFVNTHQRTCPYLECGYNEKYLTSHNFQCS